MLCSFRSCVKTTQNSRANPSITKRFTFVSIKLKQIWPSSILWRTINDLSWRFDFVFTWKQLANLIAYPQMRFSQTHKSTPHNRIQTCASLCWGLISPDAVHSVWYVCVCAPLSQHDIIPCAKSFVHLFHVLSPPSVHTTRTHTHTRELFYGYFHIAILLLRTDRLRASTANSQLHHFIFGFVSYSVSFESVECEQHDIQIGTRARLHFMRFLFFRCFRFANTRAFAAHLHRFERRSKSRKDWRRETQRKKRFE